MSEQDLLQELTQLERELHQPAIRSDRSGVKKLLHDLFIECGRSGRVYTRNEILDELSQEVASHTVWSEDFCASKLSEKCVLLTYRSAHLAENGSLSRHSFRSSIWQMSRGAWKLRFHQGTPIEAFGRPALGADSVKRMTPRAVASSYDELADHWNSADYPRENGIEQHKRAISFLEKKRRALDVGCGSSGRFIDLLSNQGFEAEGLDLSQRMIELARKRHPAVNFHHADIRDWELPCQYDLISAWDSIWHLPLADQEAVMKKLCQGLSPGGVLIFTTGGVDAPSEKVDSAMGPQMYYSVLGIPAILALLNECGCICRHLEYDMHPELHLYIIAQKSF